MKNTEKKMFLQQEIKGLSNLEKVLLETADSVMDTRKKLEFGVQQIMFKVSLNSNLTKKIRGMIHCIEWPSN